MGKLRKEKRKLIYGDKQKYINRGKHEEPEIDLMVELSSEVAEDIFGAFEVMKSLRSMLERAYALGKGTVKSIYN